MTILDSGLLFGATLYILHSDGRTVWIPECPLSRHDRVRLAGCPHQSWCFLCRTENKLSTCGSADSLEYSVVCEIAATSWLSLVGLSLQFAWEHIRVLGENETW